MGYRCYKKVGNEESRYLYLEGKLVYEERGQKLFYYFYDSFGQLSGIRYYSTPKATKQEYVVYTTKRGDVEALYTREGDLIARYIYDAWGNRLAVNGPSGDALLPNPEHIAYLNPFGYRGYYFDRDSGLYYLHSRYYDALVKRFLNADSMVFAPGTLGANVFAYCGNNPVNCIDSSGRRPLAVTDDPYAEPPGLPEGYHGGGGGQSESDSDSDTDSNIQYSKKYTNRRDSGLTGYSDEEVHKESQNRNLPGLERKRFIEEDKVRQGRNKQKRKNYNHMLKDPDIGLPDYLKLPDDLSNSSEAYDQYGVPLFPGAFLPGVVFAMP